MIFNVETAYFNLIFSRQQYEVAKDSLNLAQELLDENNIKRRTGVLTDLDVVQAEAQVATARSQLIGFKQAKENAEDILLQALGEREFKRPRRRRRPPGAAGYPTSPSTAPTSWPATTARAWRRSRRPSSNSNSRPCGPSATTCPQLNVNGGAGYNTPSAQPTTAPRPMPGTGPATTGRPAWPSVFPGACAATRRSTARRWTAWSPSRSPSTRPTRPWSVQVRAGRPRRARPMSKACRPPPRRPSALSQKQYELQKARFDAGLATSYDVVLAQNQLETARVSELQAKVNLRIALADLRFLEGTSLQNYHINLKS